MINPGSNNFFAQDFLSNPVSNSGKPMNRIVKVWSVLEVSKMRKVFCVFLGILLIVSGCSPHLSEHCQDISDEIDTYPDMRENYNPTLTPITDVAGECYCHVEDAVLVAIFFFLESFLQSCNYSSFSYPYMLHHLPIQSAQQAFVAIISSDMACGMICCVRF